MTPAPPVLRCWTRARLEFVCGLGTGASLRTPLFLPRSNVVYIGWTPRALLVGRRGCEGLVGAHVKQVVFGDRFIYADFAVRIPVLEVRVMRVGSVYVLTTESAQPSENEFRGAKQLGGRKFTCWKALRASLGDDLASACREGATSESSVELAWAFAAPLARLLAGRPSELWQCQV